MGPDIVEIGLSSITDFLDFEQLATELLLLEGFAGIKPLGLRGDKGIDATVEKFFLDDEVNRTVFQYTTQDYLTGKVRETIKKLKANSIAFNQLIVVTNRSVSINGEASKSLIQTCERRPSINCRTMFSLRTRALPMPYFLLSLKGTQQHEQQLHIA